MLKQANAIDADKIQAAATFGWLCVETAANGVDTKNAHRQPPSGGCVLKLQVIETVAYG